MLWGNGMHFVGRKRSLALDVSAGYLGLSETVPAGDSVGSG